MKIFDIATDSEIEAFISPLDPKDFSIIKKSKQFGFDWSKLKGQAVYKLTAAGSDEILDLMCIKAYGEGWDAVKIELLEVREEIVKKRRRIDNIAGCLIAYACRESVKAGLAGYVFLTPKTDLIAHYERKYGFVQCGVSMALDSTSAIKLIRKYL